MFLVVAHLAQVSLLVSVRCGTSCTSQVGGQRWSSVMTMAAAKDTSTRLNVITLEDASLEVITLEDAKDTSTCTEVVTMAEARDTSTRTEVITLD